MLESYPEIVPLQWKRLIWDISNDNAPPGTRINPLQTTWFEQGIVSSRVALLLRSAEIKPLFVGFVLCFVHLFPIEDITSAIYPLQSANVP